MKTQLVVKVLLILTISSCISAVHYCGLCSNHIACGNNGKFAASCPNDAAIVKMTRGNEEVVLRTHNSLRNSLAGGRIAGFKSASKMMILKWDAELATLAELNVKQCQMKHDKCRATQKYPRAGQNLYYTATTGKPKDINVDLSNAVHSWFNEYKLTSQSSIDKCCGGNNFSKIGHFLQMAQDQVVAVGCAASRYTNGKWKTTLIACNYSYINMLGDRVYVTGSPGSACPKGRNSVYTNLCNS